MKINNLYNESRLVIVSRGGGKKLVKLLFTLFKPLNKC